MAKDRHLRPDGQALLGAYALSLKSLAEFVATATGGRLWLLARDMEPFQRFLTRELKQPNVYLLVGVNRDTIHLYGYDWAARWACGRGFVPTRDVLVDTGYSGTCLLTGWGGLLLLAEQDYNLPWPHDVFGVLEAHVENRAIPHRSLPVFDAVSARLAARRIVVSFEHVAKPVAAKPDQREMLVVCPNGYTEAGKGPVPWKVVKEETRATRVAIREGYAAFAAFACERVRALLAEDMVIAMLRNFELQLEAAPRWARSKSWQPYEGLEQRIAKGLELLSALASACEFKQQHAQWRLRRATEAFSTFRRTRRD